MEPNPRPQHSSTSPSLLCRIGVVLHHAGFSPEDYILTQQGLSDNRKVSNGANSRANGGNVRAKENWQKRKGAISAFTLAICVGN